MIAIGEFARHGRVSVRMLRHYDATGLLEPGHVDPATGYRYYEASGYRSLGYAREVTLKIADVRDDWVTELQEPIAPREAA